MSRLDYLKGYEMMIDANYKKIKFSFAYRASSQNHKAIKKAMKELLKKKIIQKSINFIASSMIMI